ncbi:hypothetical protein ACSSS7_000099 [Eimeria intestinalis]
MGQNCVRPGLASSRESRKSGVGPSSLEEGVPSPSADADLTSGSLCLAGRSNSNSSSPLALQQQLLRETLSGGNRKWRVASPSLVYCLINRKAARHAAVVFDCRAPHGAPSFHWDGAPGRGPLKLHYAVCPWRGEEDVTKALQDFNAEPPLALLNQPQRPPVSRSAAANPAARSSGFVWPRMRLQTLKRLRSSLKQQQPQQQQQQQQQQEDKAKKQHEDDGELQRSATMTGFTPTAAAAAAPSDSAAAVAASNSSHTPRSHPAFDLLDDGSGEPFMCLQFDSPSTMELDATTPGSKGELPSQIDRERVASAALSRMHSQNPAATAAAAVGATQESGAALAGRRALPHLQHTPGAAAVAAAAVAVFAAAAVVAASAAVCPAAVAAAFAGIIVDAAVAFAADAAAAAVSVVVFVSAVAMLLRPLKTAAAAAAAAAVAAVNFARAVVAIGDGDDDPLLLQFLRYLQTSETQYTETVVLAGGIRSLIPRYSLLFTDSDILLPGPTEIIAPDTRLMDDDTKNNFALFVSDARVVYTNQASIKHFGIQGPLLQSRGGPPLAPYAAEYYAAKFSLDELAAAGARTDGGV